MSATFSNADAKLDAVPKAIRQYTSKQMGDACEMLVAAELTLAGIPALKVPDNWPHYDVIAQPRAGPPQRISVKSRTFKLGSGNYVSYQEHDQFDWLALVVLQAATGGSRKIYLIPRSVAEQRARRDSETSKTAGERYFRIDEIDRLFGSHRDNFALNASPTAP